MSNLKTALFVLVNVMALVAAGACSSHVSEGGSETNWLCGVDGDCRVGQRCVDRRCEAAGGASTVLPGPDAGVGGGAGRALQSQSTIRFTRLFTVVPDPAECTQTPCINGTCLPMALERDQSGRFPCSVIDVVASRGSGCDSSLGLRPPSVKAIGPTQDLLRERGKCDAAGAPACNSMSYCERTEATGSALQSCLNDPTLAVGAVGWCYADPENGVGSAAVVDKCPGAERRLLRFPPVTEERMLVIACSTSSIAPARPVSNPGKLGDPFIPGDETRPEFSGYSPSEVYTESRTPSCESGVGIVYGFTGRVGCPYGQPPDSSDPAHVDPSRQTCFTSSGAPVTVPVPAQVERRPPSKAVYCSCRCDGPDPSAAYCDCPGGFECKRLVADYGFGSEQLAGSYCIKAGTELTPGRVSDARCDPAAANCGPLP